MSENSDVYVYADAEDGCLRCCGCMADFTTTAAMIEHMRTHIANGEKVPAKVIPALEADREENDAWLAGLRAARGDTHT
jgi:hypothetical protein